MSYTLKLDLSTFQHDVLCYQVQRGISELRSQPESPVYVALKEISEQITGYDESVAEAKRISQEEG